MRTEFNTASCHCTEFKCSPQDTSLIQSQTETKEEWRDRITDLIETSLKSCDLWLRPVPRSRELCGRGEGHNFCLYFAHALDYHVLVTPHNRRGVDVSVAKGISPHVDGLYDVSDLTKVVRFLDNHIDGTKSDAGQPSISLTNPLTPMED